MRQCCAEPARHEDQPVFRKECGGPETERVPQRHQGMEWRLGILAGD